MYTYISRDMYKVPYYTQFCIISYDKTFLILSIKDDDHRACKQTPQAAAHPATMQHDDLIWRNVNETFCSYKAKTVKQIFCRNKYNLTGLCSRMSCPLANSRYATIIEDDERLLLYIKTVERAHSPRNLWEKITLSSNYRKALAQIDTHLVHWPAFYVHKAKQRLTKMTQYVLRRRKLALRTKTRLIGVKKKVDRREFKREKKAHTAAKLETAIEKELLERLRGGTYGDIYNFPLEQYEKALDEQMADEEEEEEVSGDEYVAEYEASDDDSLVDVEEGGAAQAANGFDFDDSSDEEDDEETGDEDVDSLVRLRAKRRAARKAKSGGKGKKGKRHRGGVRVEMEYENEVEARTPQLERE